MKSWRWDAVLLKNSDRVNQRRPETRLLTSSWVVNFWVCESGFQSCPYARNAAFSLLSGTESALLTLERKSSVWWTRWGMQTEEGEFSGGCQTLSAQRVWSIGNVSNINIEFIGLRFVTLYLSVPADSQNTYVLTRRTTTNTRVLQSVLYIPVISFAIVSLRPPIRTVFHWLIAPFGVWLSKGIYPQLLTMLPYVHYNIFL